MTDIIEREGDRIYTNRTPPCGHANGTHPSGCWYVAVCDAVVAERERIANLFPRFIHGEMFDETPESALDLDSTAFAIGERFRFLIGAYPYREGTP